MVRSHSGLAAASSSGGALETLRVHCQQGASAPSSESPALDESVLEHALVQHDPKRLITPVVNRTLHSYHSVLRILCRVPRSTCTAATIAARSG